MHTNKTFLFVLILSLIICTSGNCQIGKDNNVQLGAYYFDGWTSEKSIHLTKSLTDTFSEREPKWGWITSTQPIMNEQIETASDMGLSFFSFCWYYNSKKNVDSSNRALGFYINSPERTKLKFCLMVANHQGYEIGPKEWPFVVQQLIKFFKTDSYLTVGGKPLLIFYTANTLISNFGNAEAVHKAFDSLTTVAEQNGLKGVTFADCSGGEKSSIETVKNCGFDIITGYNYHTAGFTVKNEKEIPIDSMMTAEKRIWDYFPKASSLPYIPIATLNWDPRPWANPGNHYDTAPYFIGFSPNSVSKSVSSICKWINEHPLETTKEKIALLYAWNEYGEGAWLTPTKKGVNVLSGVKKVLLNN